MNLISKIFSPGNILLDSESTSKKRVFERVGMLFENEMQIGRSQVFDSLFAREKLGSTGLGQGVAIPHGRIPKLRDATAAFVRTTHPIPFDAPDGQPGDGLAFAVVRGIGADVQRCQIPRAIDSL